MAKGDAYFDGVTLKGLPPELLKNPEQLKQYARAVKKNAGSGSYNWSEVTSIVQQGTTLSGATPKDQNPRTTDLDNLQGAGPNMGVSTANSTTPPPIDTQLAMQEDPAKATDAILSAQEVPGRSGRIIASGQQGISGRAGAKDPKVDIANIVGGITRDKGPLAGYTLAGTAIGALGGNPIAGAGIGLAVGAGKELVDMVAEIISEANGKKYTTDKEAMSDAFDAIGVKEPENEAERVMTAIGSGAVDAGLTLGLVNLVKGLLPKVSSSKGVKLLTKVLDIAADAPAQEYGANMGAGGFSQAATEITNSDSEKVPGWLKTDTAKTVAPVVAGLGGAFLGGGITSGLAKKQAAQGTSISTDARNAIDIGDSIDAPVTGLDLTVGRGSNVSAKAKQQRLKGTAGPTAQLSDNVDTARAKGITNLGEEFEISMDNLGYSETPAKNIAQRFIDKHKAKVQKYGTSKKNVIERVGGEPLGPNYEVSVAADGKVVRINTDPNNATDFIVSPNGDAVNMRSNSGLDGGAPVDTSGAKSVIDGYINLYTPEGGEIPVEYKSFFENITRWEAEMEEQGLAGIEKLRSRISSYWEDADDSVGKLDKKIYRDIYNKLNDDMGKHIEQYGGRANYVEWKTSNTEIAKLMDSYDVPALKTALREGLKSPEQVMDLAWDAEPQRIADLVEGLELKPDETNILEQALMRRMLEKSITPEGPSGNILASILQEYSTPIKKIFSDTGYERIQAWKDYLTASSYHEEIATGRPIPNKAPNLSASVPLSGTVASQAARKMPGVVLPSVALLSKLQGAHLKKLTSPEMRVLLRQLSRYEPQTTGWEKAVKRINSYLRTEGDDVQSENQLPMDENLQQQRRRRDMEQSSANVPYTEQPRYQNIY